MLVGSRLLLSTGFALGLPKSPQDRARAEHAFILVSTIAWSEAELQQMVFRRNGVKIEDRAQWTMSGSVFYDGSCLRAKEPELATAAFAVVEIDEQGQATATFEATVQPGWPQTSQAAEQGGRLAAVRLLSK